MAPTVAQASPFTRRLLLVEDESMTAALLVSMLRGEGFEVESASNVPEARALVASFDPDCVLIDISLGVGPSGADLAYMLHRERPDIALLFLTRHPDLRTAGITEMDVPPNCGFVRKDRVDDSAYIVAAIEQVLREESDGIRDDADPARPLGDLTAHQIEVLRLMSLGFTNDAIAKQAGVSRKTVERWVAGVLKAMNIDAGGDINPRVEAARRYVQIAGIPPRP